MKSQVAFPKRSLRTKLVLSYLGVALGAILVLSIAVTLAVQYNFANQQRNEFMNQAETEAQQVGQIYHMSGGNWNSIRPIPNYNPDSIQLVVDNQQRSHSLQPPPSPLLALVQEDSSILGQCLGQALQGNDGTEKQLQATSSPDGDTSSAMYTCEPIRDNGQSNGQIIGALLLVKSDYTNGPGSMNGPAPYGFMNNVTKAILIAGGIIALVVAFFSLMLARSLTNPLRSLTNAAEKMQSGDYAQRVVPPTSEDEIEHLSLAFNAMAGKIESDVTELRRQELLRRDMIANIAHDMLTPLTAVQGFSEALADDVITDSKVRQETAQLIGREVQRLRRLVSDMQQMTSLEAGRLHFDFAPLNMSELVNETVAVIEFECEQVGITVQNEMPPTTPLVRADGDRITQVLLNLLDNARRHTPAGGTITIGAKPEEQFLAVWVSDTGTGIDPADLPYIFERFYRADHSRTGATGGSGLGLSIVKAIITAHGGAIHAESQPGQGTRIQFTLPLFTDTVVPVKELRNPFS